MDRELKKYVELMSSAEGPLLAELDRVTNLRAVQPQMSSGHVQGGLLTMLTQMLSPKAVLEIGTFTGYATLCFAAGLADGAFIDTIEADDELQSISAPFFARSPHASKIRQHTGAALDVMPALDTVYDLVFIDGDKREYPDYYQMLMGDGGGKPMVRPGSVILADNILWYGKVADLETNKDLHTRRIDEFNRMVRDDDRVGSVIIPIRDGINMIRVK